MKNNISVDKGLAQGRPTTQPDQKDIFDNDLNVPEETIIYYSKTINYFQMAIILLAGGYGFYWFFINDEYIFNAILFLICAYLGHNSYKKATNKKPQIILNHKGIQTSSIGFRPWKQIQNEEVVVRGYGKSTSWYLTFKHFGVPESLLINDFNINPATLNKLLRVYRARSENKSNGHTFSK
jgi:hypothetical protein